MPRVIINFFKLAAFILLLAISRASDIYPSGGSLSKIAKYLQIRNKASELKATISVEGYTLVNFSLDQTVYGYNIQLNGTIEAILAYLKQNHPTISIIATIPPRVPDLPEESKINTTCCPVPGQNFATWAGPRATWNGARYLSSINGTANLPAHSCARVSCSYGSGIFTCNGGNETLNPMFSRVTNLTSSVLKRCVIRPGENNARVCGQAFDDSSPLSVVIQGDYC